MSNFANVTWYVCHICNKSVMWIHRENHKLVCKECKEQKSG